MLYLLGKHSAVTMARVMTQRQISPPSEHDRFFVRGTLLLGPGFGRLLPMPLLAPWAWKATFAATMLFPMVGMLADRRRDRRLAGRR